MTTERRRSLGWAMLAIGAALVAVMVTLAIRKRPAGDAGAASRFVLDQVGRDLEASVLEDAAPDEDFRVDLFQDEGYLQVSRAIIDLDRDGHDDERWTFHLDGRISRRVATSDDEEFSHAEIYDEGRWREPESGDEDVDPGLDSLLDDVLEGIPEAADDDQPPSRADEVELPSGDEPVDIDALLDQMRAEEAQEAQEN